MRNHPTCPLYFIRSSRPLCFRAIYAEQTVFKGLNTPKYVSYKLLYICPHTGISVLPLARHAPTHTSHVSIRQHTSAYNMSSCYMILMYIYIYICIYIYIYMYIHTYIHTYIHIHTCMCVRGCVHYLSTNLLSIYIYTYI